jgi:hypothetical protein
MTLEIQVLGWDRHKNMKKTQKKSMSEDACKVKVRRKYKPNKNSMTNPGTKQEFIKSTGNETTFLLRASTPSN